MECNKEEAIRAKEIAEKKMQDNDFVGARKTAVKAQQLYPGLENISKILIICDVHCSAETRVGSEKDWYSILQVDRTADGASINKQYRKLALLLHPDKNTFPGSEGAFQLIGEAQTLLMDPAQREIYDLKCNAAQKQAKAMEVRDKNAREEPGVNPHPGNPQQTNQQVQQQQQQQQEKTQLEVFNGRYSFWKICPFCSVRYEYQIQYLDKGLCCPNCGKVFIGHEVCPQGMASGGKESSAQKEEDPCQDSKKTGSEKESTMKVGGDSEAKGREDGSSEKGTRKRESKSTDNCRSQKKSRVTESPNAAQGRTEATAMKPDPETLYYNFEKDKVPKKILRGQIWAMYCDLDGLPKFYAQIKKVKMYPSFRLQIRWLESCSLPTGARQWVNKEIPICCGTFTHGSKEELFETASFSHMVSPAIFSKTNMFEINPGKGEVWALYKNFNPELSLSDLDECEYEIVEVRQVKPQLIQVLVLEQDCETVHFGTIFRSKRNGQEEMTMEIPAADLLRFSYQIPAFQLRNKVHEKLQGCWELDPKALPESYILDRTASGSGSKDQ